MKLVDQKKMVQVSARIPLEDRRALRLIAARDDTSIQELIASKGQNESLADRMAAAALQDFRSRR